MEESEDDAETTEIGVEFDKEVVEENAERFYDAHFKESDDEERHNLFKCSPR